MSSRRTVVGAALLLNTLALRSFQIVQLTSIAIEAIALRLGLATHANVVHHSSISIPGTQTWVCKLAIPSHSMTKFQSLLV
jgi:hypothetical protein